MTRVALKARLRGEAARRRDALEIDDRLEWDRQITENLLGSGLLTGFSGTLAAYWPMRSEADTRPLMVALQERGLALALPAMMPRADGDGREIAFLSWKPWEPIIPGGFGTLVPLESASVVQPTALIVPLLAFDRRCHRLGYGKGHYDRAIATLRARGPLLAIGIGYAAQEIGDVPAEAHDQGLDAVATERGITIPDGHNS
ncbi:MAG: 5-formyltetrahydrofolate cyclo-ligase [Hyphomicrobiales bacterium]|nr:5-formyltetrahydrofolate cyclo-ligase [Hyphomicrobiales bacterium]